MIGNLDTETAVFDTVAEARAAADAAMPRRIHNRPYPISSGYHWNLRGRDTWIVCAYPNLILLRDGRMWDYSRNRAVRP